MAVIYDLADTWNNVSTTFTAIKMNVTDTASASGSLLLDLQVGGSSKFKVDKAGDVVLGTSGVGRSITTGIVKYPLGALVLQHAHTVDDVRISTATAGTPVLGFYSTSTAHVQLHAPAANILEQRRSTNAQTFNIYNTYTDASNYERGFMKWNSNVLEIGTEALGTGTARAIKLSATDVRLPAASGTFSVTAFGSGTRFLGDNGIQINGYNGALVLAANGPSGDGVQIPDPVVIMSALPTADPVNAGQLWNDSGTLKISAG